MYSLWFAPSHRAQMFIWSWMVNCYVRDKFVAGRNTIFPRNMVTILNALETLAEGIIYSLCACDSFAVVARGSMVIPALSDGTQL